MTITVVQNQIDENDEMTTSTLLKNIEPDNVVIAEKVGVVPNDGSNSGVATVQIMTPQDREHQPKKQHKTCWVQKLRKALGLKEECCHKQKKKNKVKNANSAAAGGAAAIAINALS